MNKFISIIWEEGKIDEGSLVESVVNNANLPLNESQVEYFFGETDQGAKLLRIAISKNLSEDEADTLAQELADSIFETGLSDFDLEFTTEGELLDEETYDGDEFFETYGVMWFNEDEVLDEAEYQGRKVPLGRPMRSKNGPKKFHVYVKNSNGNIVKVNFGDPNMEIKRDNPERKRNFRARHNCDNPGPRTSAKFWSCRNW
jgi:hypothetical protein